MIDDLRSTLAATGDAIRTARDEMAGLGNDIEQLEIERDQWRERAEKAEQLNLKLIEQAKEQAATIERVRALAQQWAALGPADEWADTVTDTLASDAGRVMLAALDQPKEASDG